MYNLDVNLATSAANAVNSLLMVDGGGNTPRTPEILNSVIAMTSNPLDSFAYQQLGAMNTSSDSNSSSSSQLESPTATAPPANNPPSVQQTCSQLIKAGLKLTIEQKRKHQSDGDDLLDLDQCTRKRARKTECSEESEEDKLKHDGMQNWAWYENDDFSKLTPEDEERRRRRRERNKIAATKCRLKKREKTANLVLESESLDAQNRELKTQLKELQSQKQNLVEMLSLHRPHCQHNITPANRDSLYRLPPVGSVIVPNGHSFAAANPPYAPNNNNNTQRAGYCGHKAPSIVIDEVSDNYQPQLTNLDNQVFHYNNQCHNYNNYTSSGMENGCMA